MNVENGNNQEFELQDAEELVFDDGEESQKVNEEEIQNEEEQLEIDKIITIDQIMNELGQNQEGESLVEEPEQEAELADEAYLKSFVSQIRKKEQLQQIT